MNEFVKCKALVACTEFVAGYGMVHMNPDDPDHAEPNIPAQAVARLVKDERVEVLGDPLGHDDGAPGGSNEHEPPALKGKNKAELLEIAAAEGAEIEDGATNPDIIAAIELKREAVANGDEGGSDAGDDAGAEGEANAGETDGAGERGDDGAPSEASGDVAP